MPVADPSMTLVIPDDGVQAIRVGPSLNGWIYRCPERRRWYRFLPVSLAKVRRRHSIQQWQQKPPPAPLAPIGRAWPFEAEQRWFAVRYDLPCPAYALSELAGEPDLSRRVKSACMVLDAFAAWRSAHPQATEVPVLATTAEMLCTDQGGMLLTLPDGQWPGFDAVAEDSSRAFWLAPEVVRGQDGSSEAADRYALGTALLQCFRQLPRIHDAGAVLLSVAKGEALAETGLRSTLPAWARQIAASAKAVATVRLLLQPDPGSRCHVDLFRLSAELQECARKIDPIQAARDLRDADDPLAAFNLIVEVLRTQTSYDLYMLAGTLAADDLNRALEALDLFEKAIVLDGDRPEAYEAQFDLIANSSQATPLGVQIERDLVAGGQVDVLVWRDFRHLQLERLNKSRMRLIRYLLWRQRFEWAAQFIHPLLFDEDNNYKWWEMDLSIAYVRALIGLKQFPQARATLNSISMAISRAWQNAQQFDRKKVRNWSEIVSTLDERLSRAEAAERASGGPEV